MSKLKDLLQFETDKQSNARYEGAHFAETVLREAMLKEGIKMLMCLVRHDEVLKYDEENEVNLQSYARVAGRLPEGRFCLTLTKSNLRVYGSTPESAVFRMLAAILDGAWYPLTPVNSGYPMTHEKKELASLVHELRHTEDELKLVDAVKLADRLEEIMRG